MISALSQPPIKKVWSPEDFPQNSFGRAAARNPRPPDGLVPSFAHQQAHPGAEHASAARAQHGMEGAKHELFRGRDLGLNFIEWK